MKFIDILLPVVTDNFAETVTFYQNITKQEVALSAAHDGYYLKMVGSFVILGADEETALEIPRKVNAIFLVEDIDSYWTKVQSFLAEILVPVSIVSTGRRFIIKQKDNKIIEYLELNKY